MLKDWRITLRILILGSDGMLGHKIVKYLNKDYNDVYATVRKAESAEMLVNFVGLPNGHLIPGIDAYQFDTVASVFEKIKPDAVINCIGYGNTFRDFTLFYTCRKITSSTIFQD